MSEGGAENAKAGSAMRIMFVCHGNICRSPMAECVMKSMRKDVIASSAATTAEEIVRGVGNPVYPPARKTLLAHGLDPGDKRAVRLTKEDYDKYDLFVGMDDENVSDMRRLFSGDPKNKIRKLLAFAGEERDVSDPWYTGDFATAYRDVERGVKAMCAALDKGMYQTFRKEDIQNENTAAGRSPRP